MALAKESTATIGIRVPLEIWMMWKKLPEEKKALAKNLFLVLLFGVTKAEELDLGETREVVLKADPEFLQLVKELFGNDDCKRAVARFYEKLKANEIGIDKYNAAHIVRVWLKPCFE